MKPTIPDVLPLAHKVYARHIAGCCLHVVLDDCNTETYWVQRCLERAREQGHADCAALAEMLLQMSETQRKQLHHLL